MASIESIIMLLLKGGRIFREIFTKGSNLTIEHLNPSEFKIQDFKPLNIKKIKSQKLFYYFVKIRKGTCIKTNPVVFECCFEGSQKVFWFWKLLGCAQGVLWVANISQFLTVFCTPYKVVKIKHPFGMLQSNIQVLQDLVGFFLFKNMFCWDTLMSIPLIILTK